MHEAAKEDILKTLVKIVWAASDVVMNIYNAGFVESFKEDGSPVTRADMLSHNLILSKLSHLFPGLNIISEEGVNVGDAPLKHSERFWLVDPLDGTKEFIKQNGEFTVNIGLIESGKPIAGVVGVPAQGIIYAGAASLGSYKVDKKGTWTPIFVSTQIESGLKVLGSRSHLNQSALNDYLLDFHVEKFIPMGSSLKFCKIAEGAADLYPRLGPTMAWDNAAGHAILEAAGGSVETLDGEPIIYGKSNLKSPHFVAKGNLFRTQNNPANQGYLT